MRLTKTISFVLLFVYSMLTLGIGIYYCGCTHSQQLAVLAVNTECPPCSKSVESCCPHSDSQPHQDEENSCQNDDCCSLEYQYIDVDQLNIAKSYSAQFKTATLFSLPLASINNGIKECSSLAKNHSPPPDLFKPPIIYLHRQLLL